MVKERVKSYIRYQFIDLKGVVPEHRWCERTKTFFLNSSAGQLRFKPRSVDEATRFRNEWVNAFDFLVQKHGRGEDVRRSMFLLYAAIRCEVPRVRWKANLDTRVRARLCSLGLLF
jgi:hypothetical protein